MIRVGVICPSEIALRRFMPALKKIEGIEFAGIGVCTAQDRAGENIDSNDVLEKIRLQYEKANSCVHLYGGKIYEGYRSIIMAEDVDALYIPLPPALHYKWSMEALMNGKHVLIEKPSTLRVADTICLTQMADKKNLALHENYMFMFHNQIAQINEIIRSGEIGDVRLYRISFGFPQRDKNDFRYNRKLGGGALMDAGGYTIKYAMMLLGENAQLKYAQLNYTNDFDVDIYGSAAFANEHGITAQIAFGMDNAYKCELEVWGSKGILTTGRILTAPVDFIPTVSIKKGNEVNEINLSSDDSFQKSIEYFIKCIQSKALREKSYRDMILQSQQIEEFDRLASI